MIILLGKLPTTLKELQGKLKLPSLRRSGWLVKIRDKEYFILKSGPDQIKVFIEYADNSSTKR